MKSAVRFRRNSEVWCAPDSRTRQSLLSGEIPATLTQCPFFLKLELSGNRLEGEPETIYNLTALKHLDLTGSMEPFLMADVLGNLTHLEFLNLSENSLRGPMKDTGWTGQVKCLTLYHEVDGHLHALDIFHEPWKDLVLSWEIYSCFGLPQVI